MDFYANSPTAGTPEATKTYLGPSQDCDLGLPIHPVLWHPNQHIPQTACVTPHPTIPHPYLVASAGSCPRTPTPQHVNSRFMADTPSILPTLLHLEDIENYTWQHQGGYWYVQCPLCSRMINTGNSTCQTTGCLRQHMDKKDCQRHRDHVHTEAAHARRTRQTLLPPRPLVRNDVQAFGGDPHRPSTPSPTRVPISEATAAFDVMTPRWYRNTIYDVEMQCVFYSLVCGCSTNFMSLRSDSNADKGHYTVEPCKQPRMSWHPVGVA